MSYLDEEVNAYHEVAPTLTPQDLGDTCATPDLHKFEANANAQFFQLPKGRFYYECRTCGTTWVS